MSHKRKKPDPTDPQPLNFDHDEQKGPSDHLSEPFMTPEEARGSLKDDQFYDEEEFISPEEAKLRKQDGEDLSDE